MMFTFIIHAVKLEWAGFGGRAKGSGRIRDESPIPAISSPRDIVALCSSSPSPPSLESSRRPTRNIRNSLSTSPSIAARLEAADTTEDESSRANTDNGLLNLEEDLAVLTNNNAGVGNKLHKYYHITVAGGGC
ncbi:unnamed protein product [Fasciola hepatica]|uniref:Uncharacterized protein n=1 Tax=Fasciola hepatica TaxID=6192 RepID=A0ABC9HH84_FASHE